MNDHYTRDYNPPSGSRVASSALINEFQTIENGFDSVQSGVANTLRQASGTAIAALPNAVSRATKVLSFDADGNPRTTIAEADLAAAVTAASSAASSAGVATTQAGTATTQAVVATTQAGVATTKAAEASASASSASTSSSTATTQAGIATAQASSSSASAGTSSAAASTATTKAAEASSSASGASTSASTATTQAGIATTQAGIATTQAGVATTQAGIATTKAAEAAASAASISGSVTSVNGRTGAVTGVAEDGGVFVISINTTAVRYRTYVLTATLTLTLPASPVAGDWVRVVNRSGTTTPVIGRNSQNIMGLAEDMTLDNANASLTLTFADSTRGWIWN